MTIVVGVDGSAGSEHALCWAIEEARWRRDDLRLVHAWSYALGGHAAVAESMALLEDAARALLDQTVALARSNADDVEIAGELAAGGAARALVEASKDAELLVVGSRGHGAVAALLLGSVADACVRHAHCPVVVVRK